jgi:hypothetical protein
MDWFGIGTLALEAVVLGAIIYHITHMTRSVGELNTHMTRSVGELKAEFAILSDRLGTVTDSVDTLEREKLLHFLEKTASRAEHSLIHYSYTFRTPDEEGEMRPLLEAVKNSRLQRTSKRFLGPDYRENLNRLYSRHAAGAWLRVNEEIKRSDLRFQIADGQHVVLTIGAASEQSRVGFLIESVVLARILTDWFDLQWAASQEYEAFIKRQVKAAAAMVAIQELDQNTQIQYVSDHLRLDIDEVRRLWSVLKDEAFAESTRNDPRGEGPKPTFGTEDDNSS